MNDFLKKCIESIPDGLDAGLNNAEDDDAKDDDVEDDDAEDDASEKIVDLTNESQIDSRRSSKRARQKPDWYGELRGDTLPKTTTSKSNSINDSDYDDNHDKDVGLIYILL